MLIIFYFVLLWCFTPCSSLNIVSNEYDDYLIDEFEACYIYAKDKLQRKQCGIKFLHTTTHNHHNNDKYLLCNLCLMDPKEHECNYTSIGSHCEKFQYQIRPSIKQLHDITVNAMTLETKTMSNNNNVKQSKRKFNVNTKVNENVNELPNVGKEYFLIPRKCILGSAQWRHGNSKFWHFKSANTNNQNISNNNNNNNENHILLDWWLRRDTLNKGKHPLSALNLAISLLRRGHKEIVFYGDSLMQQIWEYFVCDLLRSGVQPVEVDYGGARRIGSGVKNKQVVKFKHGKIQYLFTASFLREIDFPPPVFINDVSRTLTQFTRGLEMTNKPAIILSSQIHLEKFFFSEKRSLPTSKEADLALQKAESNFRLIAESLHNIINKTPFMHIIYVESFAQHFPQSLTGVYHYDSSKKNESPTLNTSNDDGSLKPRACDARSGCCESIYNINDVLDDSDGIVRHLDHVYKIGYNNINNNNSTSDNEILTLHNYGNLSVPVSGIQDVQVVNHEHIKVMTMMKEGRDGYRWQNNNNKLGGMGYVHVKNVTAKYCYHVHSGRDDCTHLFYIPGFLSFLWQKIESVSEEIDKIDKNKEKNYYKWKKKGLFDIFAL